MEITLILLCPVQALLWPHRWGQDRIPLQLSSAAEQMPGAYAHIAALRQLN